MTNRSVESLMTTERTSQHMTLEENFVSAAPPSLKDTSRIPKQTLSLSTPKASSKQVISSTVMKNQRNGML